MYLATVKCQNHMIIMTQMNAVVNQKRNQLETGNILWMKVAVENFTMTKGMLWKMLSPINIVIAAKGSEKRTYQF